MGKGNRITGIDINKPEKNTAKINIIFADAHSLLWKITKISIRKSFFPGIVLRAQQIEGKYAKIGVFFMKSHDCRVLCFLSTAKKTFVSAISANTWRTGSALSYTCGSLWRGNFYLCSTQLYIYKSVWSQRYLISPKYNCPIKLKWDLFSYPLRTLRVIFIFSLRIHSQYNLKFV